MKILVTFFAILFFFTACSRKGVSLNITKHHIHNKGEDIYFSISEKNNSKRIGQIDKEYFWYKAQRIRSTKGGHSGILLNGNYECLFENKQLKEQGEFKNGLKTGEWKFWNDSGSIITIQKWKRGKLQSQIFYTNHTVVQKESFRIRKHIIRNDSIKIVKKRNRIRTVKFDKSRRYELINRKKGQLHGRQFTIEDDKKVTKYFRKGKQFTFINNAKKEDKPSKMNKIRQFKTKKKEKNEKS